MHRFFVPPDQLPIVSGSDAHQIKDVLRMKSGDQLELLDGTGKIYSAKISRIEKDQVVCAVLEHRTLNTELGTEVTIAQCVPKAKKMDNIIQKCTELGVARIIPTLSERSIAKGEKLERWKKIAKEAAEQSGRATIPAIAPLTKFDAVLKLKDQFDLALIPWELEKETALKSIVKNKKITNLLILIGPEGGFSQKEIDRAKEAGFTSISLGKRILRTETAGMAMLAMLAYELE
jgi:16S rRNA (uracil1498-N3)-methyltransferase